jgi:hypothetical protein
MTGVAPTTFNNFIVAGINPDSAIGTVYNDGLEHSNQLMGGAAVPDDFPTLINAWDNYSTILDYVEGVTSHAFISSNLSADENLAYNIVVSNFDTALNRGIYIWEDADAEAYYDALVVANGGDIDTQSIYSVLPNYFKKQIDDCFVSMKSGDGGFSKIGALYLVLGGTADTHAVEAIGLGSTATYIDSPLQGAYGIRFDGLTQKMDTGLTPIDAGASTNDCHLMYYYKNVVDGLVYGGAASDINERLLLSGDVSSFKTRITSNAGSRNIDYAGIDVESLIIGVRTSGNILKLYENGVNVDSNTNTNVGSIPTDNVFLGGTGSGAGNAEVEGDLIAGSFGTGFTDAEALNVSNAIITLNNNLGR